MSIGPIANLATSYLQSIFSGSASNRSTATTSTSQSQLQPDSGQLSPFAQLMSELQQLQQSNPTQYQQVTQQIAGNLQSAAQTATSQGNTTAATQLNQLASDFTSASQNSQLPNVQDLAQAVGGGHHHHHHGGHHATSTDSSSSSSTNSLLAAFQSNTSESDALNPMAIIMNTLSTAGIGSTQS